MRFFIKLEALKHWFLWLLWGFFKSNFKSNPLEIKRSPKSNLIWSATQCRFWKSNWFLGWFFGKVEKSTPVYTQWKSNFWPLSVTYGMYFGKNKKLDPLKTSFEALWSTGFQSMPFLLSSDNNRGRCWCTEVWGCKSQKWLSWSIFGLSDQNHKVLHIVRCSIY